MGTASSRSPSTTMGVRGHEGEDCRLPEGEVRDPPAAKTFYPPKAISGPPSASRQDDDTPLSANEEERLRKEDAEFENRQHPMPREASRPEHGPNIMTTNAGPLNIKLSYEFVHRQSKPSLDGCRPFQTPSGGQCRPQPNSHKPFHRRCQPDAPW